MRFIVFPLLMLFTAGFGTHEKERLLTAEMTGSFYAPALMVEPVHVNLDHEQLTLLSWDPKNGLTGQVKKSSVNLTVNGEEVIVPLVSDFFIPYKEEQLAQLMVPIPIPSIEIKGRQTGEKVTIESIRFPGGWKAVQQLSGVEGALRVMLPHLAREFDPSIVWTAFGSVFDVCESSMEGGVRHLHLCKSRSKDSLAQFVRNMAAPRENHNEGWMSLVADGIRAEYGPLMEKHDLDLIELLYLFAVRGMIHQYFDADRLTPEECVSAEVLDEALERMELETFVDLDYRIEGKESHPLAGETDVAIKIDIKVSDGSRLGYVDLNLVLEGRDN